MHTCVYTDKLLFDEPANAFTASCPLGNGRLGGMMFGSVVQERIILNDITLWSGGPQDADRPDAHSALPEIRRLLLAGDNVAADELVNQTFTCQGEGSGRGGGAKVPFGCYQTLGNLARLVSNHPQTCILQYRDRQTLVVLQARQVIEKHGELMSHYSGTCK